MSASPVVVVRSLLFDLFFYVSTTVYCLAVLPAYPFLSAPSMRRVARVWQRMVSWGLRVIVGLSYEVRGREYLPRQPAIVASKHQSAWETLAFHVLVPEVAVCLKEELTHIPVFGWYLMRAGSIRIDRGAAARAIRSLVLGAKRAVAQGLSVQIYPEGTRRSVTDPPDYKPGVVALYSALRLPVVPVALNSGLFWPRHGLIRQPGRITVEFLPPIPAGLDRKLFMRQLETTIETATARLLAEARPNA
ncbi:MAG: lysophospholipid acyltransferase family protein [Geminicoccaceae bacterium]